MSTQNLLLLIAQRAFWRDWLDPQMPPGFRDRESSKLPKALRRRWWEETNYGREPHCASDELVELLKHFDRHPGKVSCLHPMMTLEQYEVCACVTGLESTTQSATYSLKPA
jgi:hypothetical protein